MMLIHADQERALNYLSSCIEQVQNFGKFFLTIRNETIPLLSTYWYIILCQPKSVIELFFHQIQNHAHCYFTRSNFKKMGPL